MSQAFLEERAPALEQPDAGLGRQVPEEREPHAEPGVLGRAVGRRLLQQLEERPLALLGDAEDGLAAPAGGLALLPGPTEPSRSRRRSVG